MPLSILLERHIIKSSEKLGKSNVKVFCKACVEVLGEEAGKNNSFPNKTDRIIQHLNKCAHFMEKMTSEERYEIFALSNKKGISNEKRPTSTSFSYDTASNSSKASST
ncbi:5591_t:CDS:2 [Dentiscutata erythropus]|uniref:5591_t:CDS:1 n=1 Tax=Dentiscutata erythropus TaxID=1348616 RepID=A0A9N9P881_9GLOM|nr:5591_t:CDS:2 [Dentiscutata erythropus]